MQTVTSSPDVGMEEEFMPALNKKSNSDDVMISMRRLQEKTVPFNAVKLGKRRRSENEACLDDQWQNFLNDQNDEDSIKDQSFGQSKRQKISRDKWHCSFAPTARKSSLVETEKSCFSFSPKKRDIKATDKKIIADN